jgi:hypothetical protein
MVVERFFGKRGSFRGRGEVFLPMFLDIEQNTIIILIEGAKVEFIGLFIKYGRVPNE